jgi:antitoxin (DNA-binding transcriptional repressor) of toxin-antitoxin stability system
VLQQLSNVTSALDMVGECGAEFATSVYFLYVMCLSFRSGAGEDSHMDSVVADYATVSEAREHLKDVLDAAQSGRTVTVARGGELSAIVALDRLRDYFSTSTSARVRIAQENGNYLALMEGRPFFAEGASVDDALADLALTLRDYAEAWELRLQYAPNHSANWGLVQLIKLSTDSELVAWLNADSD